MGAFVFLGDPVMIIILSWIDIITGGSLRCLDTWLCKIVSVCPSVCLSRLSQVRLAIKANNGEIRKANLAFAFSFLRHFTVTVAGGGGGRRLCVPST